MSDEAIRVVGALIIILSVLAWISYAAYYLLYGLGKLKRRMEKKYGKECCATLWSNASPNRAPAGGKAGRGVLAHIHPIKARKGKEDRKSGPSGA